MHFKASAARPNLKKKREIVVNTPSQVTDLTIGGYEREQNRFFNDYVQLGYALVMRMAGFLGLKYHGESVTYQGERAYLMH